MDRVLSTGVETMDRTGTGTLSVFGAQMRFDLAAGFPVLTTKKLHLRSIIVELLWFLRGDTNVRWLQERKVAIWDEWADEHGDLGPVYGKQWVDWDQYEPVGDGLYRRGPGINQIAELVRMIRQDPTSRRLLFTGWNVAQLGGMALPPCHMTYQFHVAGGRLSGMLWQRSCDLGLGFAFNAFSAALLIRMLAQQCDLAAGELVWSAGDAHVYLNHAHLVGEQLARPPRGSPRLRIHRRPESIFGYAIEDFAVEDYDPHPAIAAPVAV